MRTGQVVDTTSVSQWLDRTSRLLRCGSIGIAIFETAFLLRARLCIFINVTLVLAGEWFARDFADVKLFGTQSDFTTSDLQTRVTWCQKQWMPSPANWPWRIAHYDPARRTNQVANL